jgi:hypothetical protein
MATLSRMTNDNTYHIRSIVMSTSATLPLILGCMYLLVTVESNLNEDAQVLFFFFILPLFTGSGFMATMLIYSRLYRQSWHQGTYRTAGLLASVISIPAEWFIIYITSHFSLSDTLVLWIIIMGTWILTLPTTWILLVLILRHRYNNVFIW